MQSKSGRGEKKRRKEKKTLFCWRSFLEKKREKMTVRSGKKKKKKAAEGHISACKRPTRQKGREKEGGQRVALE